MHKRTTAYNHPTTLCVLQAEERVYVGYKAYLMGCPMTGEEGVGTRVPCLKCKP